MADSEKKGKNTMKRKIVNKKILDELIRSIEEAGRKDNRAALRALDCCDKICDDFLSVPINNILCGQSELVLDYIKSCGGDPLFESGEKKFELVWKDGQYVLEGFDEKFFYDDWGNKIAVDEIDRISQQTFINVKTKSTIYKVYAFYRNGTADILGVFDDKDDFDAYYKNVVDAFGLADQ